MKEWTKWIERQGIRKVAKELEVNPETVRLWVAKGTNPADKHKKKLVELCDNTFSYRDFF